MNIEEGKIHLSPKSYKDFYEEIAKECEVHPDLVDDLIRFFYDKVRRELENLNYSRILLPNLGTFITRKGRLDRAIKRHKDMLGNMEKITYKGYHDHLPLKSKLDKMIKASDRISREQEEKNQWRNENK